MAIASLSPSSVLASPIQVNPQVKTDLQTTVPQVAENSQKSAKETQTDTITISPQALKMADDKDAAAKETAKKAEDQQMLQLASDNSSAAANAVQKNALKAYTSASTNQ